MSPTSLLLAAVLLGVQDEPPAAPPADLPMHYLSTPQAFDAEPGVDYVALPNGGPKVIVKNGPVVHPKLRVLLEYSAVVYLNIGIKNSLPLASSAWAQLANDAGRRNAAVENSYADGGRGAAATVTTIRWYLVVYKVEQVAADEWKIWVVPTGSVKFGGDQTGSYRVPFKSDGTGAEVWRYRDGDGEGAGWTLLKPAAAGGILMR